MENGKYLVAEAEKLTGEKAHVLRYWEEELGMEIHRNSLGHRCYTAQDIQIFLGIRELKKKGLHLKAIRELMPKLVQATAAGKMTQEQPGQAGTPECICMPGVLPGQEGMENVRAESMESRRTEEVPPELIVEILNEKEAENLADTVMRQEQEERKEAFYGVLGRLLDQMIQKQHQEERSRRVDEAIRRHQQSRREAAATMEQKGKRNKKKNAG